MKFFWGLFGLIFFWEVLSFFSYANPLAQSILFLTICLTVLLVAIFDFKKGLAIALVELFVGGFGYLFSWQIYGPKISLRIALFIILMCVYLGYLWRQKRIDFLHSHFFYSFSLFSLFLLIGLGLSWFHHYDWQLIYNDFNAFIFLAYIFPFYHFFKTTEDLQMIFSLLKTSTIWLSLKIIFSFSLFASNFSVLGGYFYKWIRDTRVGEITQINEDVYRIFFQSAIFLLFFIIFYYSFLLLEKENKRKSHFSIMPIIWAAVFITLSRSFWLGLAISLIILFLIVFIFLRVNLKKILKVARTFLFHFVGAILLLILIMAAFSPSHNPLTLIGVFNKRIETAKDAAISTRIAELAPLLQAIGNKPFLGYGFGKTLSFISSDPRILAVNLSGEYTTFSFEWGWLDLILKIGIFGTLSFIYLLYKIIKRSWILTNFLILRKKEELFATFSLTTICSLLALSVIHIFTPYLNHPLGLGWLIICLLTTDILYLRYFISVDKL